MISKRKQWLEDVVEETINSDNNVFSDEFYNNKATSQEILHVETFSNTLLEDCNLYAIETAKASSVDLSFSAPAGWSGAFYTTGDMLYGIPKNTYSPNDTIYLRWNITNNGTDTLENWNQKGAIYIDGEFFRTVENYGTTNIAPGVNKPFIMETIAAKDLTDGQHTIRIVIDPDNTVSETNENNNYIEHTITVDWDQALPDIAFKKPENEPASIYTTDDFYSGLVKNTFSTTEDIYIRWIVSNNGTIALDSWTPTFEIFVNDESIGTMVSDKKMILSNDGTFYSFGGYFSAGAFSAGTYTIKIVADPANQVQEYIENNNSSFCSFTVVQATTGSPDLYFSKLNTWTSSLFFTDSATSDNLRTSYAEGENVYFRWQISNGGDAAAIDWDRSVDVYVDGKLYDTVSYDTLVKLGTNNSLMGYYALVNHGLSMGQHTIKLVLDPQNTIAESNENNNVVTGTFTVAKLSGDLSFQNNSGWAKNFFLTSSEGSTQEQTSFAQNDKIYLNFSIKNDFNTTVDKLVVSVLVDGRKVDEYIPLQGIKSGQYWINTKNWLTGLSVGSHTLTLRLDSANNYNESSESNNSISTTFSVSSSSAANDLRFYVPNGWSTPVVVSNKTNATTNSTTFEYGEKIYFNLALANDFTSSKNISIKVLADGIEKGVYSVTASANGTYTLTNKWMDSLAIGTHNLQFIIDPNNSIAETNENNNSYSVSITVNAPPDPFAKDHYEGNDTQAQAAVLGNLEGTKIFDNLTIHNDSDSDWYKFTITTSGKLTIDATKGKSDLNMTLIMPGNNVVSTALGTQFTIAPGDYYLNITGKSATEYALSFSAPVPVTILPDSYESGSGNNSWEIASDLGGISTSKKISNLTLHSKDDKDWFKFSTYDKALSSHNVTITGNPDDLFAATLYSTNGNKIGNLQTSVQGKITLSLAGQPKGDYLIFVETVNGEPVANYSISITAPEKPAPIAKDKYDSSSSNNSRATATNLSTISGAFTATNLTIHENDEDWFKFTTTSTGVDGDEVSISFTHALGNLDLYLYDASGNLLTSSLSANNTEKISMKDRAAGTYYVRVAGWDGATSPSYNLNIVSNGIQKDKYDLAGTGNSRAGAVDLGNIASVDLSYQAFSIHDVSDKDYYKFVLTAKATAGDYISVWGINPDISFSLLNSSGSVISSGKSFDDISLSNLSTGTYYLLVESSNNATGEYYIETQYKAQPTLSKDKTENTNGKETVYNLGKASDIKSTQSFTIHDSSDYDQFKFTLSQTAQEGDKFVIKNDSGKNLKFTLTGPNINTITGTVSQGSYTINFNSVATAGDYYLTIGDTNGGNDVQNYSVDFDFKEKNSEFDIEIIFDPNSKYTTRQKNLIMQAAEFWESVIIADITDVTLSSKYNGYYVESISLPQGTIIDDHVILMGTFTENSNTIGYSGITSYRGNSKLPLISEINYNTKYLNFSDEEFYYVVLHEMCHSLGFAPTIWELQGRVRYVGKGNTIADTVLAFYGANTLASYKKVFGTLNTAQGSGKTYIKMEDVASGGSWGSHWEDSVFLKYAGYELMNYYSAVKTYGAPKVSAMTINLFKDLGYTVDLSKADPYGSTNNISIFANGPQGTSGTADMIYGDLENSENFSIVEDDGTLVAMDDYENDEPIVLRQKQTLSNLSIHNPAFYDNQGDSRDEFLFTLSQIGGENDTIIITTDRVASLIVSIYDSNGVYIDDALMNGNTYSLSLSGYAAGGYRLLVDGGYTNYELSINASLETASPNLAPVVPEIMSKVHSQEGVLRITWDDISPDETSTILVRRMIGNSGNWEIIGEVESSVGYFEDNDFSYENEFIGVYYSIAAKGENSMQSAWSAPSKYILPATWGFGEFYGNSQTALTRFLWESGDVQTRSADNLDWKHVGNVGSDWGIVGIGDFDNNGTDDYLLQNSETGGVSGWLISDGGYSSATGIGWAPAPWYLIGIGDFNADGTDDILLRNCEDGGVASWLLKNGEYESAFGAGWAPYPWEIVGIGDFNGDNTDDVLLLNIEDGGVSCWLLKDGAYHDACGVGYAAPGWNIAGVGDMNGDGSDDVLLWNQEDGGVACWLLEDGTYHDARGVGYAAPGWSISGLGDFNGDGCQDVILSNTDGEIYSWLIEDGQYKDVIRLA